MNTKLRSYLIGVTWFMLSLFSSSINDIITKYVGLRLHSYEITFFRFLFGTITLIPFIYYHGTKTLRTTRPLVHMVRGILLFCGISGWSYGLTIAKVTTATVITFTIPIFVLILGIFFLSENIIYQRWFAIIIAFGGLAITIDFNTKDFNWEMLVFIASAISFAILDIFNKKFVVKESMISMLFYSAMITTILSLPFAICNWSVPTTRELLLLLILGISANLILFFILQAFSHTDATAVIPYRYFELIISAGIAYIIFLEIPDISTIYGALIVIPLTLFLIYSEKKELNREYKKL